jgi:hypothetical protein
VKTTKDRKSISVYTFAFVLMLILLFSLSIGIVGGKPGKVPPGKPPRPPPEPETADFKIWIEEEGGTQDIKLTSPSVLDFENVAYSGGQWEPPPAKRRGKPNPGANDWGVQLLGWEGDVCGTYDIAEVNCDCCEIPEKLTDALYRLGIDNGDEAYFFGIYHIWPGDRWGEEADYWKLFIEWDISSDDIWDVIGLVGDTDKDLEPEGTYNEEGDGTWTVPFNEVRFSVYETGATGPEDYEWTGQLSFTVEIQRMLVG